MSAPEQRLSQMMYSEYRKHKTPKHVGFVEPKIIVTGQLPTAGFVVTRRDYSIDDWSSLMAGDTYVTVTPVTTPRIGDVGYVPIELANKGIVAVKATSPSPTSYARCEAIGCTENHPSHYCITCQQWNVKHQWIDCPLYKCVRY